MTVLGIESATDLCAAALVAGDGRLLAERTAEGRGIHSARLVRMIGETLADAGVAPEALGGIAVSIGPGSFTGLRIGLSVAKGIAYAAGIPLAAVPTLEALAEEARARGAAREGDVIAPVLHARRGEVYAALYEIADGSCRMLREPADLALGEVAALVPAGRRTVFCGNAAAAAVAPGAGTDARLGCSAPAVARLGIRMLASPRGAADLASLEPLYIKEFISTAHL